MLTRAIDRPVVPERIGRIRFLLPAVLGLCAILAACGKSPDRRAYDDVVATMSLQKARQFFERYPGSPYRDRLVDDIIEWCRRDGTEECSKMILGVIPRDHPRYQEVVSDHERRFKRRAR